MNRSNTDLFETELIFLLISPALLFNLRQWKYQWRYLRGKAPWECGQTPDEVMEFINTHPPGKAIDLGCAMGTHALALARHGWEVTGIDFAALAIRIARARAVRQGLRVGIRRGQRWQEGVVLVSQTVGIPCCCKLGKTVLE